MFRFRPIPIDEIRKKLNDICEKENIYCSKNNIENIITICKGDLRKAVNLLQKCKRNMNFISTKKKINEIDTINQELIHEISGIIPGDKLNNFITACLKKNIIDVNKYIEEFYINAYSLTNQIEPITQLIIKNKLTNEQKAKIIGKLVEIDQNLIKGCDEYIQFFRLGYYIMTLV